MGLPEYLFPTNFQIPLRIKLSSPKKYMYIVIQCGLSSIVEDGTTISVVDCVKFSVLVNQCVRPSCSLEDFTYPKKRRDPPYHFCSIDKTWLCCLMIFITYFTQRLGDYSECCLMI